jgi:hypothetical protein
MSYISEVGLAIQDDSLRQLVDSEYSKQVNDILGEADSHFKNSDGNHLFVWESIKWYDSDETVDAFMKALRSLDDQSGHLFLEMGESPDHLVEEGHWYNNDYSFGIIRQLSYDDSDSELVEV